MKSGSVGRTVMKSAALVGLAAGLSAVSASAADASLLGTHWRLLSVAGHEADVSRREPHIVLAADGSIAGSTGCNNFGAGYRLDGSALSFGRFFTTRMYCQKLHGQEQAILDALPLVARWQVSGERLELQNSAGIALAVFEAVPGANCGQPGGDASSSSSFS